MMTSPATGRLDDLVVGPWGEELFSSAKYQALFVHAVDAIVSEVKELCWPLYEHQDERQVRVYAPSPHTTG